jgi:hypothetical protein
LALRFTGFSMRRALAWYARPSPPVAPVAKFTMTKQQWKLCDAVAIAMLSLCGAAPIATRAQHTVAFSTSDPGDTKSVAEWGVDTAWPGFDNVRHPPAPRPSR